MDWITTKQAAEEWGISVRRVQVLCDNGQVNGATKLADMWVIPKGTSKPIDGRTKAAKQAKLDTPAGERDNGEKRSQLRSATAQGWHMNKEH